MLSLKVGISLIFYNKDLANNDVRMKNISINFHPRNLHKFF